MNRHCFFILLILLALLPAMAAGAEELRGAITDAETGAAVGGAVVQALDSAGKPIAFASSAPDGSFKLKVGAKADSLAVRCLGYESVRISADDLTEGVRLRPEATRLNDVIVQAPDIYAKGDTLVFNVAQYANAKDDAIIDVIKRLPGIKVEKDGTIKYQGKPINKFYIDGNDMIGGQYGLATENISHEDVKAVEVMENHQPVKALEGIEFPEESGINLKLRDDARSRWAGVAKAAAGADPAMADASVYAMRIAPQMQNIVTLRGGNTGWNPAAQITDHGFLDMFSTDYSESLWPEYISADMINAPLSEKRTRDNLSWIANAISGWKKGDNSMRLKLDYVGDRLDYNTSLRTDYFSQSIPDFLQNNSMRTQSHELSAQFNSEINKRGYYFKDLFTATASTHRSESAVTGTSSISQRASRRRIDATNDLKLVKRTDKRLIEISSRNSFMRSPESLDVSGDEGAWQSLGITDIRSTTESKYGRLSRFWKFYIRGGADLNYRRIDARLSGMGPLDNNGAHDAFLAAIYATPQIDYERHNWRISMRMPVKWLHHSIHGSRDYANAAPTLTLRKKTSSKSEIAGMLSYRLGSPQAYLNIEAPIMADYRNIFEGESGGGYTHDTSASMTYRYRNPLNSLFANASASYAHRRESLMPEQRFDGDIIISSFASRLSDCDSWSLSAGLSKGLGHSKMVVGCDISASGSSASSMRDGKVSGSRQATFAAKPYFKGSLARWMSVDYEARYGYSRLTVGAEAKAHHALNQTLIATWIPSDRMQFTIGADHFLTHSQESGNTGIVLLDASAVWRPGRKIRISLTADNLLDKRRYRYVTYGTLSRTEHTFSIRPRRVLASVQVRF